MKDDIISIIVPVYNENEFVLQTINEIQEVMKNNGVIHELIAVDDNSTDGSYEKLKKESGIKLIKHKENKGYGASLKTGIIASQGEWILIIDADGTYPVEDIPKLLKYKDEYDMIVGARIGKTVEMPLFRRPAKWFLGKIANYIASVKIPDLNSGLRIFRKDIALKFWKLYPERFSFTSTITMAFLTNNYKVKYVPIDYYKRKGKSTIHPIKDFINFNKLLFKLCLFFRPLKIFVPMSIVTFLTGSLITIITLLQFNDFPDITFLILTITSIQIFILGLIAELIVRR